MAALHPDQVLAPMLADLRDYAESNQGRAELATSPWGLYELIAAAAPGGWLAVLVLDGDTPQGAAADPVQSPVSRHEFRIVVAGSPGLPMRSGDGLVGIKHGRPGLLRLTSEIRSRVLAWAFDQSVYRLRLFYQGTGPETAPDGYPLNAYAIRLFWTVQLPVNDTPIQLEIT